MKALFHPISLVSLLVVAGAAWVATGAAPGITGKNPEVGDVNWGRDFPAALKAVKETGKPALVLFQEVPGCAGCRKFGQEVLTHKPLVEAIETEFVPVLIYNNRSGTDAEILKQYREPAWNYQVIRFLDSAGDDLIPRKDGVWTIEGIALRMADALEAAKRKVPPYLELLADESDAGKLGTAAFAMDCFWVGEAKLGAIDGVVGTEAGWLQGREVTLVRFHKDRIAFEKLVKEAAKVDCARKVYAENNRDLDAAEQLKGVAAGLLGKSYRPASRSDQKKQIQRTPFEKLDLSPAQAAKVNAFARTDPKRAITYLTPAQRAELDL